MEHYILEVIANNSHIFSTLGYYIIFFSGLLESVPLFGFIVPGQTIIVIGGFFAKKRLFAFFLIFLIAALGAIFGDLISFFIGRKYGDGFLRKHGHKFFVKESLLHSTKKLVQSNPGKTLFFGRLNSVTRSLAPFLAGTSDIDIPTFLFYCITGGIAWAGIFVSVGYLFGKSFEIAAPVIGKFVLIATIIVALLIALVQYMKKRGFTLSQYNISMLVTNAVSLYVFAMIGQAVAKGSAIITAFDDRVYRTVPMLRTSTLDYIMIGVSKITELHFIIFAGVLCVLLFLLKRKKDAWVAVLALVFGNILVYATKIVFDRPRPLHALIYENGSSFPSGHATMATLFFLIVIHTFSVRIKESHRKIAFVAINVFLILFISLSRIYLGVHFATDVIAGTALGAWIFSLSELASKCAPWFYRKVKREQIIPNL